MSCTVTIESRDPETGEVRRDVFELTPAPPPGDERRVLVELVTGIHPNAVEVSWSDGVAVLDDGGRAVTATFGPGEPDSDPPPAPDQGTLFG
ncbi:MAG TPA: hypothetical protein PKD59_05960 [Miltoncostaeaceae bacterium]|nr:hypothetical protein [Miltoncostaeaceae bacterium]